LWRGAPGGSGSQHHEHRKRPLGSTCDGVGSTLARFAQRVVRIISAGACGLIERAITPCTLLPPALGDL
jgi:hypothetical protein